MMFSKYGIDSFLFPFSKFHFRKLFETTSFTTFNIITMKVFVD